MGLTNMGLAANEAKEQRIMRLRNAFNYGDVYTIKSVMQKTGYSRATIIKWAKQGNIPLFDERKKQTVVPVTDQNRPNWLGE